MEWESLKNVAEEADYCWRFVQLIRSILFFQVEPGESRDKLGLVMVAKSALEWIEDPTRDVSPESLASVKELCQQIIADGSDPDKPLPGHLVASVRFGL